MSHPTRPIGNMTKSLAAGTLVTLATLASTGAAHAERGDLELSVTTEQSWLLSDSAQVTSDGTAGTPQVRFGYSPLESLDLYVGWRMFGEVERNDRGYIMTSGGDAVVVGARGRYPLLPWLAAVGELDLEALHMDESLIVGTHAASSDGWTFGAVPKLGIEATLDLGGWACVLRVEGGYAWRMPLAVDDVRFPSAAAEVVAVDLGDLDLSGPVFAATFAVRF